MKKALLGGILLFLLGLLAIRWAKLGEPSETGAPPPTVDLDDRQRVSRFWTVFQNATRLRTREQFQDSAEAYREALELDPEHQESLYYLASSLVELGDYREARETYERLLALEPNSPRGLAGLAILLSSPFPGNELDLVAARASFEKVSLINPEQSGPFLRLGGLSLQTGDLEQALEHFQTAAGFRAPEGFFLSGLVLFRLGEFERARGQFERVLEIQSHERAIAGRGGSSEGDTRTDPESTRLSPLDSAALKSRVMLKWIDLAGHPRAESGERRARQPNRIETLILQSKVGSPASWNRFGGLADLEQKLQQARAISLPPSVQFDGKAIDVARADFDGDGQVDIYLLRWKNPGMLWRNLGEGHYEDVTAGAGLEGMGAGALSVLVLDYDRDGQPDLLFSSQADAARALQQTVEPNLAQGVAAPQLFQNRGGHFFETTTEAGLTGPFATLRILSADLNGDSWPDLVLVNGDFSPETLLPSTVFLNREGSFEEYAWIPDVYTQSPARDGLLGDFDSDGRIEIYLAGVGLFRVH